MKSKLNQHSDLESRCKMTAKTAPDSQNQKAWIEPARQYEQSEHRKAHLTRKQNGREGTEEKDSKPARGSVQLSDCTLDFHYLKRGDRTNTITKTNASTYAPNTMCFNNKLSFLSLVSSNMLIRRECDWQDNMSIMGAVRLKFLFVTWQ